jgi:hypothetical protein
MDTWKRYAKTRRGPSLLLRGGLGIVVNDPNSGLKHNPGISERELRARLGEHGIIVLDGALPSSAPPPLTAVRAVTGAYVQPTVTVPHSAPDLEEIIDRSWREQATRIGLHSDDGRFLMRLSNPSSEARGWLQVRDEVAERLPSRMASATGCREFIVVSLNGKHLCAISLEDDEDWIVTHEFT